MKLDKFLVEASIGTRKKAREYIKNKLVKVNEIIIVEPSFEINEQVDVVDYNGVKIKPGEKKYYMFHKPGGCVTARADIEAPTVMGYFKAENMEGIFHVGRLDKDTEGLLLFTNDGEFNKALMHPEKDVEKKYFFWALGSLSEQDKIQLEEGLSIGKDEAITKPAKIKIIHQGTYEDFEEELKVVQHYDMKRNHPKQPVVAGYLTISEGRKHQVKRMLKAVGCYVIYLKRVSIGNLKLDENLNLGEYRVLKEVEIKELMNKVKG